MIRTMRAGLVHMCLVLAGSGCAYKISVPTAEQTGRQYCTTLTKEAGENAETNRRWKWSLYVIGAMTAVAGTSLAAVSDEDARQIAGSSMTAFGGLVGTFGAYAASREKTYSQVEKLSAEEIASLDVIPDGGTPTIGPDAGLNVERELAARAKCGRFAATAVE